jgi:hypothetical protein
MDPWARFNTFKVPKIIDRPAAIKNRTIPTLIPLKVCPAIASKVTRFTLSFQMPEKEKPPPRHLHQNQPFKASFSMA